MSNALIQSRKGKKEMYKNFTVDEANTVGKKFLAVLDWSGCYNNLTEGKVYEITVIPKILTCSPLVEYIGDDGKLGACHLERFTKVEEVQLS